MFLVAHVFLSAILNLLKKKPVWMSRLINWVSLLQSASMALREQSWGALTVAAGEMG